MVIIIIIIIKYSLVEDSTHDTIILFLTSHYHTQGYHSVPAHTWRAEWDWAFSLPSGEISHVLTLTS